MLHYTGRQWTKININLRHIQKKFADFEVADIILNAFKNNIITKEQIRCIKSLRKSFPELIAKAGVQL